MRERNGFYLPLFIGLCLAVTAQADVITYQQGADNALVTNYAGTEDTVLVRGTSDTGGKSLCNYGGYSKLLVGNVGWSGTTKERSVLRFDLTSLAGQYSAINSVTLRLDSVYDSTKVVNLYEIMSASGGWNEGTQEGVVEWNQVCWAYRRYTNVSWGGSAGCGTAGTDYVATPLATVTLSDTGIYDFTFSGTSAQLTALIDYWTSSATNAGMLLCATDESTGYAGFGSSERAGQEPQLIIDYTPVPEPATMGLLAVGGLGILLRRKR